MHADGDMRLLTQKIHQIENGGGIDDVQFKQRGLSVQAVVIAIQILGGDMLDQFAF